jgi:hypothetical protein
MLAKLIEPLEVYRRNSANPDKEMNLQACGEHALGVGQMHRAVQKMIARNDPVRGRPKLGVAPIGEMLAVASDG